MVPGHAGARDDRLDDEHAGDYVLGQLTTEERLVCVWRRLGFRSRTIASHWGLTGDDIEEFHRLAVEKIRRLTGHQT
jgi:hypothetical protein